LRLWYNVTKAPECRTLNESYAYSIWFKPDSEHIFVDHFLPKM